MNDIARRKFAALMEQVEALEEQVAALQETLRLEVTKAPVETELKKKLQELAQKRTELTRVSDGCGTGHPKP
jgi:hypothetical protein